MINITTNEVNWDLSDTVHFNGIPCEVFEGWDIIVHAIPRGEYTMERDHAFTRSKEFKMLQRAGISVHSGPFG